MVLKGGFFGPYNVIVGERNDLKSMACIAHMGHGGMDNMEYVEFWHKVCKYSDNAAEVYRLDPKVVDWYKRCCMEDYSGVKSDYFYSNL